MSLELIGWSDELAFQVFRDLDLNDRIEAALWRGDDAHPLALWSDWRAWAGWRAVTRIAVWREGATILPIAVLGWQPTGAQGVVQAALLAARLADAAAARCDVAVIVTQPASKSQQNAQRRGFDPLYARAVLVRQP